MRLLTMKEISANKYQGYKEQRHINENAELFFNKNFVIRKAVSETDELFLTVQKNIKTQASVAQIFHRGERPQLAEYFSYDDSGIEAATKLFEQLLEPLELVELVEEA